MAAPVTLDQLIDAEPDVGQMSLDDLDYGLEEMRKAHKAYTIAENYYIGNVDEFIANARLRFKLRHMARAFRVNFANTPVDALVDRMRIAAITATGAADTKLQQHIQDNLIEIRSRKAELEAAKFGDAYLVAWPDPDDPTQVQTWINSPLDCRVIYDEERPLVKSYAIRRQCLRNGKQRVDLLYPDRIEKYITRDKADEPTATDFVPYIDDDTEAWPEVNPFDEIPVFHLRNDEDYGHPEHEKFYGVQNVIFKLIVAHMIGVDYHALPQRWKIATAKPSLGEASEVDADAFAIGETWDDEDEPALTSEPGGLWDLRDTASVGQFDAAPPSVFTEPIITYLKFGAQITKTPMHKLDPTGQVETGESRRAADAPLTDKVLDRQAWHGPTWAEWARFVLKVMGSPDADINVRWEPAATTDDLDAWQVAQAKLTAGVPIQQVLMEMGYEEAQVGEWFGDFDLDTAHDADTLKKIGDALVSVATAKNLMPDVLTTEQVVEVIAAVLEDDSVQA